MGGTTMHGGLAMRAWNATVAYGPTRRCWGTPDTAQGFTDGTGPKARERGAGSPYGPRVVSAPPGADQRVAVNASAGSADKPRAANGAEPGEGSVRGAAG